MRTIPPPRPMVVWSLGTVLLLGAGLLTLQAQDDGQILYFPHLAVGAGWQTTITYINYSAEEVNCQTDFLADDGSPLMVSFTDLGRVVSRSDVLPPGGSVHQATNVDLSTPLAPGWARTNCSGPVKASLLFRRYNSEGMPTAEAGVNAATVPATRFVTFAEQGEGQFGTGVAYANPSDTAAHIAFTTRDTAGQMLASANHTLPPAGHGSQNMVDLFDLTSFSGSLEVTSTEPIVSLSLNFEADPVFSSLPPGEPDTSLPKSTTYYFPHLAVGASWQTTITYINYSPGEVTCQTDFLADDGSPLMVSFTGLGTVESRTDVLPPGGSVHEETNVGLSAPLAPGWARANCSGPVKASLLFRRYDSEGVPTGEAAVNATAVPATRYFTFAQQGEGQFGTGVAYANPSSSAADVTFTARDAAGQVLASVTHNLPPGGHGSQNMVDLFDLISFSGSLEVTSTEPIVSLSLNFEADPVFSSLPPGGVEERIIEPMTDREVLEALYHATGGPSWSNHTNWLSEAPLSEWFGVVADQTGRVMSLSLGGNRLTGVIPPELGQLAHLQRLHLEHNQLTGVIPPELGQLTHLQSLSLGTNRLSGVIPSELSKLSNLQVLNLWHNQLTGVIPPELGQLTHLQSLSLGTNRLSGVIPSELSKLSNLQVLNLWHNQLTGVIPPELGQLTHLQSLSLHGNALTGVIPPELGQLTHLRRLSLGGNALTGVIPPELGQLTRLRVLSLGDNGLSGAIPRHLLQLSELFWLDIGGTGVCVPADAIYQEWLNMISLFNSSGLVCDGTRRVSFSVSTYEVREGERVTVSVRMIDQTIDPVQSVSISLTAMPGGGATTADYSGVPDMVTLTPPANEAAFVVTAVKDDDVDPGETVVLGFRRPLPSGITSGDPHTATVTIHEPGTSVVTDREVLEALYHATGGPAWSNRTNWLSEAPMSDWFGVGTDGNGEVTTLSLRANQLSGTIPPELGGLTRLQRLDLSTNQLSGTIPPELGQLTRLQRLFLGGNQLSGAIPPELGGLTRLQFLGIANNGLSGTIPPELGQLTRLQRLFLGGNQLSGAIPPELGGLTRLQFLGIANNGLSGAIPPELGGLTILYWLDLRGNQLSGIIPPELGGLTHLGWLNLLGNKLSGTIPAELVELTNLEQLDLGFNQDLTGTIPPWLSQLPLSTLSLMATSVCAPEDGELQEWLATIEFMPSGLACGRPAAAMSLIDVAVFYTPTSRRIAGGTAEMEAMIDVMVAETNQAYVESGVSQQIVLVAREEIEYTESGNTFRDIERFADPSDGHMDEIHTIRNRVGADLVHLIADANISIAIGIPSAFGLTCAQCDSLTFAHELGHNMGLNHDRNASPRSNTFPYSHGYVNQRAFEAGAPVSARWRTIMAYGNQCGNAGFGCNWIMRLSNPNQTYLGDPLGVPGEESILAVNGPADAVRTLNLTRNSVADFRARASATRFTLSSSVSQARPMVRVVDVGPQPMPAPGGALFREIAPTARGVTLRRAGGLADQATLRRRDVSVDIGKLSRVSGGGRVALMLNLFDDVVLTGIIKQRTPTYSGGYALSGRLGGVPAGTVTLVVNGNVVAGSVRFPGATFRIRPEGAGRHAILQVDLSKLPQGCEVVTLTPGRYQLQAEGERPSE